MLKAITKNPLSSKFRATEDIKAPNPNCKTPITPLATPAFFEKCSIAKDIQFPKMNAIILIYEAIIITVKIKFISL